MVRGKTHLTNLPNSLLLTSAIAPAVRTTRETGVSRSVFATTRFARAPKLRRDAPRERNRCKQEPNIGGLVGWPTPTVEQATELLLAGRSKRQARSINQSSSGSDRQIFALIRLVVEQQRRTVWLAGWLVGPLADWLIDGQ